MTAKICAIVLAAGRSSRMGEENKLLLPWRGRTMVRQVAEKALRAPFADMVVVTGHQEDQVREALENGPARLVHNPDYAAGLSTSVRCGVEAAPGADGYAFLLGDMPQVGIGTLEKLVAAFKSPASLVVPTYQGKRGNPAVIGALYRDELLSLRGDRGARPLLQNHADRVVEIEVEDAGVRFDIDTPEAYRRTRAPS